MTAPPPLVPQALAARRLGLLGGSFDPPHLGHLHAARRARAAFQLDHVLFVPAARPPHKPDRILADAPERLAMLRILLEGEPDVSVWEIELVREGPSYTIDTLRTLRTLVAPETRLYLVVGEDNLAGLPRWREAEAILRLAQPIVVHRGEGHVAPDAAGLSEVTRARLAIGQLAGPIHAASSTELRARLAAGEDVPELLPPALAAHLRASGLYRRRG